MNFAAESHVDRSIENPQLFLMTNILGQNLLDAARRAWVTGKDESGYPTWRKGVRYHKCLPTKFTAHLVPKATSQSKPRSARTALTAPARRVPIW